MARTRARLLLLVASLVLVLAAVGAGFVFPSHDKSRVVAVDVRANSLTAAQIGTMAQEQRERGAALVVLFTLGAQPPLCTGPCDGVVALAAAAATPVADALKARFGADLEPRQDDPATWHATVTTSKFNVGAAVVAAALLAVVAIAVAWLVMARRRPVPVSPAPRYLAPPPPVRTVSHAPVEAGPGQAIARSHVSAAGGYVELGEIVVWAVLSPHAHTVAAPGDLLDVLETDRKNAVLTVAPALAAAQRGSTP